MRVCMGACMLDCPWALAAHTPPHTPPLRRGIAMHRPSLLLPLPRRWVVSGCPLASINRILEKGLRAFRSLTTLEVNECALRGDTWAVVHRAIKRHRCLVKVRRRSRPGIGDGCCSAAARRWPGQQPGARLPVAGTGWGRERRRRGIEHRPPTHRAPCLRQQHLRPCGTTALRLYPCCAAPP